MKVENPESAELFLEKTQIFLEKNEIKGNLIYGLSNNLLKNENYYGNEDPFYSIVYEKDEVKLIGLMTLPYKMNIFQNGLFNDLSIDIFINNIMNHYKNIPGIAGEKNITEIFVEKWSKINNSKILLEKNLRSYKLEEVNNYNKPNGIFRIAEINDKSVIKNYTMNFNDEINEPVNYDKIFENNLIEEINNGLYYVWENQKIVSMAKKVRPTKNSMTINYVYTPNKYRRNGYATAITAELSKTILNSGKKYCILFTDLSNLTSNSIYQKIGYKVVYDNVSYKFE